MQSDGNHKNRLLFWVMGAFFTVVLASGGSSWVFVQNCLSGFGQRISGCEARIENYQTWLENLDDRSEIVIRLEQQVSDTKRQVGEIDKKLDRLIERMIP